MSIFNPFNRLKKRLRSLLIQSSRAKKLDHFYALCDSNSSVLDVGISKNDHQKLTNTFLKDFRLSSNQYVGLSIEPMDNLRKKYPGKRFVEYSGGVFPFVENEFDWVFSNAVIEHVGNREDQLLFIQEMLRVSRNVFFTTPNKWFPVESHTNVFFYIGLMIAFTSGVR